MTQKRQPQLRPLPTPIQLRNCAGDPADCTNSRDRKVDSIDCATTTKSFTTITDASVDRAATSSTTPLELRNCAGDPAHCTRISAYGPNINTNHYFDNNGSKNIIYNVQDLSQALRSSEYHLSRNVSRFTQYRDIMGCDVNTSCPLIFSPLIEPEPPPVDLCNSLQVPQSGGHKYGTLYFSLRLLELMIA